MYAICIGEFGELPDIINMSNISYQVCLIILATHVTHFETLIVILCLSFTILPGFTNEFYQPLPSGGFVMTNSSNLDDQLSSAVLYYIYCHW